MKTLWNIVLIGLAVLAIDVQAQDAMPLRMVQMVPLPNVEGHIDHMAPWISKANDFSSPRLGTTR